MRCSRSSAAHYAVLDGGFVDLVLGVELQDSVGAHGALTGSVEVQGAGDTVVVGVTATVDDVPALPEGGAFLTVFGDPVDLRGDVHPLGRLRSLGSQRDDHDSVVGLTCVVGVDHSGILGPQALLESRRQLAQRGGALHSVEQAGRQAYTQRVAHVAVAAINQFLSRPDAYLAHPGQDLLRLVKADHRDRIRIELPDVVDLGVVRRRVRVVDDLLNLVLRNAGGTQVLHRVVGQAAAVGVVAS